jgi:hypothetical protein
MPHRLVALTFAALIAVIALAAPGPAAAQAKRYAVLVEGASGEPQYAQLHREWLDSLSKLLRERFKFDPALVTVLAEKPGDGEEPARAETIKAVFGKLAGVIQADDLLFVMLIGHGGGQGAEARFNLVGPDLTVSDWNELLKPVKGRIAFVNAASASAPYLAGLSGERRVIITATSSAAQKYHSRFAPAFIAALTAAEADLDKNGRNSFLEAFTYASRLVGQQYEQAGFMATERAMIDDNGDAKGRDAATAGPDGEIAGLTFLQLSATPTSSDPETQKLIARQMELTQQIDDLRRRRSSMPPIAFDQEFERLIIELALVSRDVRKRTGGSF